MPKETLTVFPVRSPEKSFLRILHEQPLSEPVDPGSVLLKTLRLRDHIDNVVVLENILRRIGLVLEPFM